MKFLKKNSCVERSLTNSYLIICIILHTVVLSRRVVRTLKCVKLNELNGNFVSIYDYEHYLAVSVISLTLKTSGSGLC